MHDTYAYVYTYTYVHNDEYVDMSRERLHASTPASTRPLASTIRCSTIYVSMLYAYTYMYTCNKCMYL